MNMLPVLSVMELNAYVKEMLDRDMLLRSVRLRGEISNFKRHSSGHLYFSMKDAGARISCVLFRQNSYGMKVALRDGISVIAQGRVALYERDGQYQFYVESIEMDGVGALYALFERTKEKLRALGYFDADRKRPLPADPAVIGVVTSPTGAVLRDIAKVARRRNPSVNILLCPAKVQGEGAAQEIANALDRLSREKVDVILCGRGGGSLEDLWAFNEEIVARAIVRCAVPVISCVGHETDFTIADMAADVRAATPSHAAELAVPDVSGRRLLLDDLAERLEGRTIRTLSEKENRLIDLSGRISPKKGAERLAQAEKRCHELLGLLEKEAAVGQKTAEERIRHLGARLRALNPEDVLRRGYAMAARNGRFVTRAADLSIGDRLSVRFADGEAEAIVERLKGKEGETN